MHYADIKRVDVANGPGVRVSLFVSGCSHHCDECFNPETWDFGFGEPFTEREEERILEYLAPSHIRGLTLLGGDPMERSNQAALLSLLRKVRSHLPEKDIWCYTGYDFMKEILPVQMVKWPETPEFLSYIDVLVDGRFEKDKKDLSLRFRGSSNQRILLVAPSLALREPVLWDENA